MGQVDKQSFAVSPLTAEEKRLALAYVMRLEALDCREALGL